MAFGPCGFEPRSPHHEVGRYGEHVRLLIGFLGLAAVIAAVREWRIRSLEKQHGPDATS